MEKKIIINFIIKLLLLLALGGISIYKMTDMIKLTDNLYKHPFAVTNATKVIKINLNEIKSHLLKILSENNPKKIDTIVREINQNENKIYKEYRIIFDRYLGNKNDIYKSYNKFIEWRPLRDNIIFLAKSGKKSEAEQKNMQNYIGDLNKKIDTLLFYAQKKAVFFHDNAIKSGKSAIQLVFSVLSLIVLLTVLMLIMLIKSIKKTQKDSDRYLFLMDQNIMNATFDINYNIVSASSALLRFLSINKNELIEDNKNILYNLCEEKDLYDIKQIIQTGKTWDGEIKINHKNGDLKWLHSTIHPEFDEKYNIIGYTNILTNITSKKEIQALSKIDALTSIYNRGYFDEIFPEQIKIAKRNKTFLVFAMIDIDHFKQYNDTYGHQDGDIALKKVSKKLKSFLNRPNDYVFRLGGEEFGMLFHITKEADAFKMTEKLRKNIEELHIEHAHNSASKFLTISIGVYIIKHINNSNIDEIYNDTDKSLYKAKKDGRNQVSLAIQN